MVQPARTLLLLFYVACLMALVMVLSPGTLPLTDTFAFNIFTIDDALPFGPQTAKVDITDKAELAAKLADEVEGSSGEETTAMPPDTARHKGNSPFLSYNAPEDNGPTSGGKFSVDTSRRGKFNETTETASLTVQFPDSTKPYQLDHFFASLQDIPVKHHLIRVLHYGDSQIEGDRVSDFLRTRLQNRFGGCGVGLVPLLEKQAFRATLKTDFAPNLTKYATYGDNRSNRGGRYGLLCSTFKFSPPSGGEAGSSSQTYRSWVRFRKSSSTTDANANQIQNVKLLYYSPNTKLAADVMVDKDSTYRHLLDRSPGLTVATRPVTANFQRLTLSLESGEGSEIYGVALDCNEGVAVDNVALRGSSGIEFTKIEVGFLRQQIQQLNVKLIVLQFGVNVIPNVLRDYTFYENALYRQLSHFRAAAPDIDILVVGVSDMARRQGTSYASYPNVTRVRDAQHRAANRAGCAFWDLYSAMGGHNSMVSWVQNKPPLAGKDYTHFNTRGARAVSEMLYSALMHEYELYKQRNNITQ